MQFFNRHALAGALLLQADGTAHAATAAVFESPSGERLRVDMLALGRSRICREADLASFAWSSGHDGR